jgi:sugar phosphate permease
MVIKMYKFIVGILIVVFLGYYSFYYFSKKNVTVTTQEPELIESVEPSTPTNLVIEDELFE